MTDGRPHESRRGVTRGYVGGLIAASVAVAVAILVAGWGGLAWALGRGPVRTYGIGISASEVIVFVAVLLLVWGLWRQAIVLLKGRRTPSWAHVIVIGVGGYLIWCLGGMLVGLGIDETWLSPFALVLVLCWMLCSIAFWGVLARRVYTDRPVPKWPWERREEDALGPDWITPEEWRRGGSGRDESDGGGDGNGGNGNRGDGDRGDDGGVGR